MRKPKFFSNARAIIAAPNSDNLDDLAIQYCCGAAHGMSLVAVLSTCCSSAMDAVRHL
jgi:hypothetical protein